MKKIVDSGQTTLTCFLFHQFYDAGAATSAPAEPPGPARAAAARAAAPAQAAAAGAENPARANEQTRQGRLGIR